MKWGQHVSNLTINYFRPVSSVHVHPNDDVKEVLSGSLLRVKSRHVDPCFRSNMADVIWIYSHIIPHTSSFLSIQSACYWELNHKHTFKIGFLFFVFGVDLVKSWFSFVVFGQRNLNVTRKKSKAETVLRRLQIFYQVLKRRGCSSLISGIFCGGAN